jgi:hypothetical protein
MKQALKISGHVALFLFNVFYVFPAALALLNTSDRMLNIFGLVVIVGLPVGYTWYLIESMRSSEGNQG